jgi:hypothetical protein
MKCDSLTQELFQSYLLELGQEDSSYCNLSKFAYLKEIEKFLYGSKYIRNYFFYRLIIIALIQDRQNRDDGS